MPTLNTEIERPLATVEKLQAENDELRLRLQEAEETIAAIRSGAVDALVVEEPTGHRIYTLQGADRPYRLFVEEMQQGAATLHADGTIAWCNRQLGEMLKTPPEKLLGAALGDFVSSESRAVYDNLLWQGKTHAGRGQAQLQRGGGGLVPAYFTFNALPKDCGAAIGVLVTDQTSLKHHEELTAAHAALRLSEERLRLAHQVARMGTFEWNIQTGANIWEPELEAMYGLPPGGFPGTQPAWEALVHPDDRDEVLRRVSQALETGSFDGEWRVVWPDGSVHWLAGRATIVKDKSGRPLKLFGVNIDITERREAEEALRESQARLEAQLADTTVLARVSSEMVHGENVQAVYESIMDAAVSIMCSDYASMQMLHPERGNGGELRLLAFRGFNPQVAKFWEWVRTDSRCTCAIALNTKQRCVEPDVENSRVMAGTPDQATYLQAGIHAVQSTPLLSRGGKLVGMISTHWRRPHQPSQRDFRLLDVLTRQAADLLERKQAEQALRDSERRFREMIDALPVVIYTTDAEGRLTHFNPAAVEFSGHTPTLGSDQWCVSFKLYHADGTPMAHDECPMAIALKEGRVIRGAEAIAERPDGRRAWFTPYPTPLRDDAGRIIGGINMLVDITERKQVEQALRRSEQDLRDFFDNATVGLHCVGPDGIILRANQTELDMLGYERDEYVGRHIAEFHADTDVINGILQCLAAGEALYEHPARLRCKDGSIRDVLINSNVLWENGKFIHTRCFTRDITERKQADESRARLAAIVSSSEDAIISKDLNGIITSWNLGAERLFGYTPQETVGQPVTMLIPPDHLDEERSILERIRSGQAFDHFETVRCRKDGALLDISLTVSPIRNDRGEVVGASKIARDISHRKRNEEALRQAQTLLADRAGQLEQAVAERTVELSATNKQLEAFAYSVAHDLRAPVRSMEGFSAMLLEEAGASLSEAGQDFAKRINRAAQFMDSLLMDLLTFSSTAQQRVELAPVKLETVVKSVLSRLEKDIQETNARVETSGPWPTVLAHEPTLGQVLFNLVNNALKFVAPETRPVVQVRAEEVPSGEEGRVRVWVEDEGIGIAPEHQEQVFRLFARLHGEQYPGTGVGLAIVQKGIERMGGRVGVESAPGQGSRFWFELRRG